MKSCETLCEDLKAYADGELSPVRKLILQWHLARCASCRKEIKRMEQISHELRAGETDNGLDSALRAKILAGVPEGAPPSPDSAAAAKPIPKWKRRPVVLWGTAAVAIMAWFALYPTLFHAQDRASYKQMARGGAAIAAATPQISPDGSVEGNDGTYGALYSKKASEKPKQQTRSQLNSALQQTRLQIAEVQRQLNETPQTLADMKINERDNPALASYTAKMEELDIVLTDLLTKYAENDPRVKKVQEQKALLQKLIDGYEKRIGVTPSNPREVVNPAFVRLKSTLSDLEVQEQAQKLALDQTETDPVTSGLAVSVSPTPQTWTGSPLVFGGTITNSGQQSITLPDNSPNVNAMVPGAERAAAAPGADVHAKALAAFDRKVHREASITVEVDNPEGRSDEVEEYVKEVGGYVANNEISTGDDNLKTASLTLKVPVQQFEDILRKIAKLGSVKAKDVTGEDITEQTSDEREAMRTLNTELGDTQSRLKVRRSRAATEQDRRDLRELKIEAAQKEARLQLLKKMAVMSDISVELNEKPKPNPAPPVKHSGFLDELKATGSDAVQSFMSAARLPVITLIWLLAYSPVLILLAVTYRYAVRR